MTDKWDEAVEIFSLGADMSMNYHDEPIKVCYSGGKDSDVLLEVAKASKKPFYLAYNVTTIDSPDTIRHIKEVFQKEESNGIKCIFNQPMYKGKKITMWQLIPMKKTPPTRKFRYCCQVLKESSINEKVVATGVRWNESLKRAERLPFEAITKNYKDQKIGYDPTSKQMVFWSNDNDMKRKIAEHCEMGKKTCINPIIKFSDDEIWNVINDLNIKVNDMYNKGYKRIGCIGCPMAKYEQRIKELTDYPIFKEKYIKAFEEMLKVIKKKNIENSWKNAYDVFNWWMNNPNIQIDQQEMF